MSYSNSNSNYIVVCNCGLSTCIRHSSTRSNPRRRFWSCSNYDHVTRVGGCRFFEWYDIGLTAWQRDLCNALMDEKESLMNKLYSTTIENARLRHEIEKLQGGVKIKTYLVLIVFLIVMVYLGVR